MKSSDLYRSFYVTCNNHHIWGISASIVWNDYRTSYEEVGELRTLDETSWEELETFFYDNYDTFIGHVLVRRNNNTTPEYFELCEFDDSEL